MFQQLFGGAVPKGYASPWHDGLRCMFSHLVPFVGKCLLGELAGFRVHHGYGLLSCVQITAYNFHLGLLCPEPFWLDTAKSTRSVVRPTSL